MRVTSLAAIQSREELAVQALHSAPQALVVQALLQPSLAKRDCPPYLRKATDPLLNADSMHATPSETSKVLLLIELFPAPCIASQHQAVSLD